MLARDSIVNRKLRDDHARADKDHWENSLLINLLHAHPWVARGFCRAATGLMLVRACPASDAFCLIDTSQHALVRVSFSRTVEFGSRKAGLV